MGARVTTYFKTRARWWDIPNRPASRRRREFQSLARLLGFFEHRGSPWQVGAAGFEARVPLRDPAVRGVVVYKVHVLGWEDPRASFHASVTIWPRTMRRTPGTKTRNADKAWCEGCRKALARHGYRGDWRRGKYHFGDFWKRLKDLRALRAELRSLERWVASPPWSA